MRLVVESLAFGAFVGIDHIGEATDANRRIRTFQLAGAAAGAQRSDDLVCHDLISSIRILQPAHGIERDRMRVPRLPGSVCNLGVFYIFRVI